MCGAAGRISAIYEDVVATPYAAINAVTSFRLKVETVLVLSLRVFWYRRRYTADPLTSESIDATIDMSSFLRLVPGNRIDKFSIQFLRSYGGDQTISHSHTFCSG